MNETWENTIRIFLNKCKIPFDSYEQLNNLIIPRETLLSTETYDMIREEIPKLRDIFSSSSLTSFAETSSY